MTKPKSGPAGRSTKPIRKISIYKLESQKKQNLEIQSDWRYFSFFRSLFISPSYWLAHQSRTAELPSGSELPSDFDQVLRVYDDFGPVWDVPYWRWWIDNAQFKFGVRRTSTPRLLWQSPEHQPMDREALEEQQKAIKHYLEVDRPRDGLPGYALLAIPLRSRKQETLADISQVLDQAYESWRPAPPTAAYTLQRNKVRDGTVNVALRMVQVMALFPEEPQWMTFHRAQVRDATGRIKTTTSANKIENEQLASRHLRRALLLSENAARGRFPSFDPLKADVYKWRKSDYASLGGRFRQYEEITGSALAEITDPVLRYSYERFAGRNKTINADPELVVDM